MKFLVSLTNGIIESPKKLQEFLKSRKNGLYTISVKKHGTRSLAQNSYYWWVVLQMIEEYTWQDKKELHYYFKHTYIDEGNFPSSAELNKWDFATYVDKIRDFASAELWLYIPDPVN